MEKLCLRGSPEQTLLRLQEGCPSFAAVFLSTNSLYELSTEDIGLVFRLVCVIICLLSYYTKHFTSNTTRVLNQ